MRSRFAGKELPIEVISTQSWVCSAPCLDARGRPHWDFAAEWLLQTAETAKEETARTVLQSCQLSTRPTRRHDHARQRQLEIRRMCHVRTMHHTEQ